MATYKQNSYNEEQLRIEFLNPLFAALGWNMDNTQGYAFFGQYLERFPVRAIDLADPADAARHARMVALVEQMLALHRRRTAARTPHEQGVIAAQVGATGRQFDKLVFKLNALVCPRQGRFRGASRACRRKG